MSAVKLSPGDLTIKAKTFLAAYSRLGRLREAAALAGINVRAHWTWMQQPAYAEAFAVAHKEAITCLEDEAQRRAVEGDEVPIVSAGQIVTMVTKRSDALLMFLLKALDKKKYAEHTTSENDNKNANANLNMNLDYSKLDIEELRVLEKLLSKLGGPNAPKAGDSAAGDGSGEGSGTTLPG